jgi:hypothetical protein
VNRTLYVMRIDDLVVEHACLVHGCEYSLGSELAESRVDLTQLGSQRSKGIAAFRKRLAAQAQGLQQ